MCTEYRKENEITLEGKATFLLIERHQMLKKIVMLNGRAHHLVPVYDCSGSLWNQILVSFYEDNILPFFLEVEWYV